jgi:hypothetical protein
MHRYVPLLQAAADSHYRWQKDQKEKHQKISQGVTREKGLKKKVIRI